MTEGQPQPKKDPKSRRFSTTVCIVILLFAFIYNTVVFVVARYPRCVASASVFHWPLVRARLRMRPAAASELALLKLGLQVYPWLEWSVYGVFNIALFTFLTGTAFVMYICCIVRDPGRRVLRWPTHAPVHLVARSVSAEREVEQLDDEPAAPAGSRTAGRLTLRTRTCSRSRRWGAHDSTRLFVPPRICIAASTPRTPFLASEQPQAHRCFML